MIAAIVQFEFGTQFIHCGWEVPDSDIGTRNLAAELFQILFPEAEHFSHPETSAGEMRMVNVARV